ncbi:MAG: FAD-dependent oxidoreductase [Clostridia bacterium]|nr:FAD-dependent oxidoreductase [Clostridia bacterium]
MRYQRELSAGEHYDLIVCGGGYSGFATAFSAAREGKRVLLLEAGYCLGGVGTAGLVNHILGVRYREGDRFHTCVKGLFSRLEETLVAAGDGVDYKSIPRDLNPYGWKPGLSAGLVYDAESMKALLEKELSDLGVRILYGTHVIDAVREGGRVTGVVVHNKSGLALYTADYFADATGDGDLCALAGAEFLLGDEEGGLAAASLEMHVENVDDQALENYMKETGDLRFISIIEDLKARGLWHFPYEIFISVRMTRPGVYMINTIRQVGINGIDADSVTRAVLEGRRENYELLRVMRAHFPGFAHATVRHVAPAVGIRETRRLVCEYTLTVQDLIEAKEFEDSIALSGYSWDLPNPKKPSHQPYHGVKRKSRVTEIPYRTLLPRGLCNVIAVGRCIGVEREALGPVRVMGPCLAMGEAAGIAVSLAGDRGVGLLQVDAAELRARLRVCGALVSRCEVE